MESPKKIRILLIEDSPTDVRLFQIKLNELKVAAELTVFRTGNEALQYLDGRTAVEGTGRQTLPDVIFLDDRLPGENSRDIVKKIKTHHNLNNIPLMVMTAALDAHGQNIPGAQFVANFDLREALLKAGLIS